MFSPKKRNKKMNSDIFKKAWSIAKNAVKKFGGKAKEYFSESLKEAWAFFKENLKDRATEKQIAYLQHLINTAKNIRDRKKKAFLEKIDKIINIQNIGKKKASEWIDCFKNGGFKIQIKSKGLELYDTSQGFMSIEELQKQKHPPTYFYNISYCLEILEEDMDDKGDVDFAESFFKKYPNNEEYEISLMCLDNVLFSRAYKRDC